MFKNKHAILLFALILLSSCSSQPKYKTVTSVINGTFDEFLLENPKEMTQIKGDFANNLVAQQFIDMMVKKHGFDRQQLQYSISQAKKLDYVLRLMEKQAFIRRSQTGSKSGTWLRYRKQFLTADNKRRGVEFWNQNEGALNRAYQMYGVSPEIIVGTIGVETQWGRIMGNTRILDALATLSFNYPRRSAYFSSELEAFLLMTREKKDDLLFLKGSFAGAMGYGQFMPSANKAYAVDFNGDGQINLWDPVDTIGSIANYFKAHGWKKDGLVAVQAEGKVPVDLASGFKTQYSVSKLETVGLRSTRSLNGYHKVSLLRLDTGAKCQYWYGFSNFYTITRYNPSTYYAMAAWQLGQAVALERASKISLSNK